MSAETRAAQDARIYARVGWILLGGLLLSIAVMALGLALTAIGGGETTHVLPLDRVVPELARGHTAAILDLGILLLFATPLAGVLAALVGFWLEGDRAFTLITSALLLLLAAGFAIALH
jgi:uncharacterized membrane protein